MSIVKLDAPSMINEKKNAVKLDVSSPKNNGGIIGGIEYLGASALAGVGGILEGTYDVVVGGISALTGNQAYAENLFGTNRVGEWHKNIEDGYNPNGALKFAGDVTTGLGQSATMLIPGVGVPLFFAGVSGQGVGTAVEKTGELGAREWIYGGVSGAVEGTLEYVLGAAGQVAGKVAKTGGKNIITRIASPIAKTWAASGVLKGVTKDMISAGAGEFMEEFLAEYIDVALQRVTGVDKEASTTLGQALYAGAVGFVSGAAMGGVASGINTALTYNAGKRAIENGNADRIVRDAHTVIDNLKLDKTSETNEALKRLKSSLESYELATNKNSDAATVYLGEVQGYMAMVEASWAVNKRAAQLTSVSEDGALAYAKVMSYYDGRAKVEQNYTAQDWFDDKNKIRTRYAAIEWAGAFFSDSEEMRQSATFDAAIAADREGRAAGTPVTPDISGAVWTGESGTYNISVGDEAQYMRVMKLSDGSYSIAVGDNSMTAQGYRGLTAEQAQAEFERIKGAVVAERTNAAQNQNLEAQERAAVDIIPDQSAQINAARRAVHDFDMLEADAKSRVLGWMQSVDGKGIDADVVSGIANIMRIRPGLRVMLAKTGSNELGYHVENGEAGRNLIVLSEGNDINLLRETITHELGHEVRGAEGFDQIKKAALEATNKKDRDEWEALYKEQFPDMTPEDVAEEVAMKALGRRLATPRFIERYANKSTLRRIIDAGRQLVAKLRADEAGRLEIKVTEDLIRMMDEALIKGEVSQNEATGESGTKYSLGSGQYDFAKPFREQVDDYINNKFPTKDSLIIGATPDVLKGIGFNALPMTINQKHVDYALNGTKNAEHHIGEIFLKYLPIALKNPVAIIASETHNATSVVAILSITHDGKQITAPVYIDGFSRQNGVVIDSNTVTSVYARNNAITKLLNDAVSEELNGKTALFYWDKKRAIALLSGGKVTMPNSLNTLNDGYVHSIRENGSPVKPKIENVTKSQQFKRWFGKSKIINPDNTPRVLYHQTAEDFTEFDPRHEGAGTSDDETPFGIFMKPLDNDIGLKGKKQMALYARIENPLVANDRADLACADYCVFNYDGGAGIQIDCLAYVEHGSILLLQTVWPDMAWRRRLQHRFSCVFGARCAVLSVPGDTL